MSRIAVLISGGGTNLQALIDTPELRSHLVLVVSNRADAGGLKRAEIAGIATVVLPNRKDRDAYDTALLAVLREHDIEWVVLAGFMRIVTPTLLTAFHGKILNIHPSLLPAFPGLHAQQQAFNARVAIAGATVHFVDGGVDTGPIIAQGAVPAFSHDSEESLTARILRMEHQLYPRVLLWAVAGALGLDGRRVICPDDRLLFDSTV